MDSLAAPVLFRIAEDPAWKRIRPSAARSTIFAKRRSQSAVQFTTVPNLSLKNILPPNSLPRERPRSRRTTTVTLDGANNDEGWGRQTAIATVPLGAIQ